MSGRGEIPARRTWYRGICFRSRLEARWAALFDIIAWKWVYEPVDFLDWVPDFEVVFACGHSECPSWHRFYAECRPYKSVAEFKGHPCTEDFYGSKYGADAVMLLGIDPTVAYVEFAHGAGAGIWTGAELFLNWTGLADPRLGWSLAGNATQWRGGDTLDGYPPDGWQGPRP